MKKLLTLALLAFILTSQLTAQQWLQPGQQWTFHFSGGFAGFNSYYKQIIEKDTVILGQPCQKLVFEQTPFQFQPMFAYQEGNQLYALNNNTLVGWVVIYDFDLPVGSHFSVPSSDGNGLFRVVSYENITAGDFSLRKQRVAYLNADSTATGMEFDMLEGIGNIGIFNAAEPFCSDFFTQRVPFCEAAFDGFNTEFICFKDGSKSYVPFPQFCTLVDAPEPNAQRPEVQVQPNPAQGHLDIKCEGGQWIVGLQLHDLQGRVVADVQHLYTDAYTLRTEEMPSGMYALSVRTTQGVATELVILQGK